MAPEDNPADDVQPTKEEWDEYEREREQEENPVPDCYKRKYCPTCGETPVSLCPHGYSDLA